MSTAMQNLPPEMQQRLAQIMAQAQGTPIPESPHQAAMAQANGGIHVQTQQQPQPPAKPPSLIEHVVALRHEVAALRQELAAVGQVTEAVGQATGQIYNSLFNTGGADYSAQAGAGEQDF